ncbi:peptidyl-prolyl cis-trans isomerase PASTICCINO1 isoform X1 [Cornus florida]|uniref:peptidyl-prolyl cis-trans isomerase PASTICCINO1 isoform X1 n=1 Tax=Cornus florida TaxID=4283 RepID=UPI00289F7E57|nr:peptidyl-prolyl cis-trans isomerase PASTICCINO1 isoform X1 [Cornus florida]
MAVDEDAEQEFAPPKKNTPSDEDERRKKIVPGSLMKGLMRPGGGDSRPADGDQVIYHCTVRTLDGVVVESTRSELGGEGTPIRHVLGKSKMILGLLEGIPTMLKGEVAMLKMKPEMHYGEDDCPVSVSDNFPKDAELHFEIEMIDFSKVKVISEDLGVLKKVVDEGQGWESPREPYEVKAWISAKTGDGKLILSRTQGEPFFFTFGKSEVPKGLEMGMGTMTKGEKAVIYVTNQYLTKSSFMAMVEGIQEVHFQVELVHFIQVRDMLGDGRLIKRRIRDGRGDFPMDCPLQDSLLRVHYKGMLLDDDKTVFYDTKVDNNGEPLEFSSGEGLVPEGLEMCVRLMLPGELALVTCPPDYAYDKFPRPANVPEGAHIQWEIELLGFEMVKDWTGLNFRAIMEDVEKIKGTGNRLFKEGKFELAKAKYEKVLREFNHVNPQDDEEGKEFSDTRNLLHLNVAACYLKIGECRKSIEACNKVLDANPVHVKALYRRGMAYMSAGDFEEARRDFNKMTSIDKSSEPNARAALVKLKQREQEVDRKVRKQFKGLFDKKPGQIADVEINNGGEDPNPVENHEKGDQDDPDGNKEEEELHEAAAAAAPPQMGFLYQAWPTGRRFFRALGLQRCSIL